MIPCGPRMLSCTSPSHPGGKSTPPSPLTPAAAPPSPLTPPIGVLLMLCRCWWTDDRERAAGFIMAGPSHVAPPTKSVACSARNPATSTAPMSAVVSVAPAAWLPNVVLVSPSNVANAATIAPSSCADSGALVGEAGGLKSGAVVSCLICAVPRRHMWTNW